MCKRLEESRFISLRIPRAMLARIKEEAAPIVRAEVASVNPFAHVCLNAVINTLINEGLRSEGAK